jgi:Flp pilus assembly protein TadD
MTFHRRHLFAELTTVLALGLSVAGGCAGFSKFPAKAPAAEPTSEDRAADVVRDFEQKRDDAQYSAAAQCLSKGDLSASQTSLQQLLVRSPEHRAARLLLAEVFVCQGQPQMAAMQLETAGKHHPHDAEIEHTLGLVRDSMDQIDAALVHYRRAAELAPDNNLYAASLEAATNAPLAPMADTTLTQVASTPTVVPQAASPPAEIQAASYTSEPQPAPVTAQISSQLPAGLSLEPDAAPLPLAQSDSSCADNVELHIAPVDHLPVGQAMAARQLGVAAGATLLGTDQLTREGLKAVETGDLGLALHHFRQAMAADPQNPQIPILAAVALLRRGETIMAVELLSQAAHSFPSSPRVHQTLGLAHYRAGNYPAAQSTLQHALRLDNTHALSYFLVGSALAKLGQREEAAKNFEQARALDPKFGLRR